MLFYSNDAELFNVYRQEFVSAIESQKDKISDELIKEVKIKINNILNNENSKYKEFYEKLDAKILSILEEKTTKMANMVFKNKKSMTKAIARTIN
jgi:predicted DNA-binding protein (UPF0251 family)